ncbi:MAG: pilus assembly protein [Pseudomonadota bacterium]|nr:pilus assembly protein [Pseudomonadota bacterium]
MYVVEFAFIVLVFLTFMFSVIEMARFVYLWNTLQEVTRRAATAAAKTDFTNVSAMNLVRQQAIFRNSQGALVLGDPVTDAHIRIEYMSLARAPDGKLTRTAMPPVLLPLSPTLNQVGCMADPNSSSCIRFVRVRVCTSDSAAGDCHPIPYVPMMPLVPTLSLTLPLSTTIAKAESLGYEPGQSLGP